MTAAVQAPKFYSAVSSQIAARPHTARVYLSRQTWDNLVNQLGTEGRPLNVARNSFDGASASDLRDCVGMLMGKPVLIDDSTPYGGFWLE